MTKIMHVVMGNDFPAAVFDTLAAAEAYCITARKKGPFNPSGSTRIHWRVYDFYLNDAISEKLDPVEQIKDQINGMELQTRAVIEGVIEKGFSYKRNAR